MNNKTVLITGASGGIGLSLSRIFAKEGYGLVLVSRNVSTLQALTSELTASCLVPIEYLAVDLTTPGACRQVYDFILQKHLCIDVLVNNAGYGAYREFAAASEDEQMGMIDLNVRALTQLTHLIVPGMLERKYGKVLNVASTAAFFPGPFMSVYYASKAYVLSFSQALGAELENSGVTITCLCPGPTQTGFARRANALESRIFKGGLMSPDQVAHIGYMGLMQEKDLVVPGLRNKIMVWGSHFVPRKLAAQMVKRIQGIRK